MTALLVALALLFLIDWGQTLKIERNPGRWYEAWNPPLRWLIAKFGAAGVHGWFSAVAAALAASIYLHPDWRWWIAVPAALIELAAVSNNYYKGIKP